MKNLFSYLILISLSLFIISCEKDDDKVIEPESNDPTNYSSLTGKAQKGPFVIGTEVNLFELNSQLGQTGSSFTSTISQNDGSFSFNNIQLNSNLALITADGFYYHELFDAVTSSKLGLQAIVDLSQNNTININLLSHVTRTRIETLVSGGQTYNLAKQQANLEFLNFLGYNGNFTGSFDDLSIVGSGNQDGILLAFSLLTQKYNSGTPADLSQLLANINTDFGNNGVIDSQSNIDALLHNFSLLNMIDIRNNINNKYTSLNIQATIPSFENHLKDFILKHADTIYTRVSYPADAIASNSTTHFVNLLATNDTSYQTGRAYSIAAIVPFDTTLTVKVIEDSNNHPFGEQLYSGWTVDRSTDGLRTFVSQRNNSVLSTKFEFFQSGSGRIEVYKNNDTIPVFTKRIRYN